MSSVLSYAVWTVLGLALVAQWARSRAGPGAPTSVPARPVAVLERLATGSMLRVVLLLAYAWAGWHLFAR